MKRLGVVFALGLTACSTPAAPPLPMNPPLSCQVTMAQYLSLQQGMSYPDAVAILGCAGNETASGPGVVTYVWKGAGSKGANMNAMFQEGMLINKAQFGLK